MRTEEEIKEAIEYHKNVEIECQKHLNSDEELSESLENNYRWNNDRSRHKRKALEWVLNEQENK